MGYQETNKRKSSYPLVVDNEPDLVFFFLSPLLTVSNGIVRDRRKQKKRKGERRV